MRLAGFAGDWALAGRMAARLTARDLTPVVRRYRDGSADYGVAGERRTAGLFLPPMARLWQEGRGAAVLGADGLTRYWRDAGGPDLCAGGCPGLPRS